MNYIVTRETRNDSMESVPDIDRGTGKFIPGVRVHNMITLAKPFLLHFHYMALTDTSPGQKVYKKALNRKRLFQDVEQKRACFSSGLFS